MRLAWQLGRFFGVISGGDLFGVTTTTCRNSERVFFLYKYCTSRRTIFNLLSLPLRSAYFVLVFAAPEDLLREPTPIDASCFNPLVTFFNVLLIRCRVMSLTTDSVPTHVTHFLSLTPSFPWLPCPILRRPFPPHPPFPLSLFPFSPPRPPPLSPTVPP